MTLAKKIVLVGVVLGVSHLAISAMVRELWAFGWDPHPQAPVVAYFELELDRDLAKWKVIKVVGGTAIQLRDVFLAASEPGNFTAVLRACRANGECSANSNRVVLDRIVPHAPGYIRHYF